MNFRQIKAIEKANRERILKTCPGVQDVCGIYIFVREEDGFKYAYVGQARKLLTRLAGHLKGYQHIDLSIRKHGLYSEENPTGWYIFCHRCDFDELDELERRYVLEYANKGYQLRNKTTGSQGEGKKDIADAPTKGYLEGLHNGYKKAQKEIARLFDLHLKCETKKEPPTKLQIKALEKFNNFINVEEEKKSS